MSYKPIKERMIFEKDIEKNETTGFWMYGDRRVCGHTKNAITKEVCKRYPMPNGSCAKHGGSKVLGIETINSTHSLSSRVEKAIDKLHPDQAGQVALGVTFNTKLSEYEKNPDIYDLRREIAKVTVLADMVIDRLSERNLAEYAHLINNLVKTVSEIKERYHKIKTGYFDIYSVKVIILQLISILNDYTSKVRLLVSDDDKLIELDNFKAQAIDDIEKVKLPIIRE